MAQPSDWSELYGTEVKQQLTDRRDFKTDRCNGITDESTRARARESERASAEPELSRQLRLGMAKCARVRGQQQCEREARESNNNKSCRFNNCDGNLTFDLLSSPKLSHALRACALLTHRPSLSHSRSLPLALSHSLSCCGLAVRGCLCFARCVVARAHL